LTERQRVELDRALEAAERLLHAATVEFDTVDPGSTEAVWATAQYFVELARRFPNGFEAGEATESDRINLRGPNGTFVVVRSGLDIVGCGGLQRVDAVTAEIKRMWIHPDWRGLGLGRRLLADLERRASQHGRTRVVLDTNGTLLEAIAMYGSAGYEPIERYNDNPYAQHWFAKSLAP
jgi:GNAT superfamily N-acetyltransferase